uniref:Uncharacterized protein n=1 Tax=uncultured marine virus TaxID=186617 RepID=A0A0F7L4H3_9VIRU|nr:hypothetical protein [uncultured marine virus]
MPDVERDRSTRYLQQRRRRCPADPLLLEALGALEDDLHRCCQAQWTSRMRWLQQPSLADHQQSLADRCPLRCHGSP